MAEHNKIGTKGEEIALEYLLSKNYKLLEKNWRFKQKEVDLIMMDKEVLVFVEVKTRSDNFYGNPEDFVNIKKQKFLIAAAEQFIIQNKFDGESRFDIISITFENQNIKLEHIQEAFYP
ncbi:MAG: YraN family protein [Bacteroidales bacterium]|jgi:putative endonuclease|nr:YraN family protein [Bacteroidales bacterium]HOL98433.1 YraN family protein [Bacteroidales bacterium]HOM35943.1 YraN family protein [Bacteroidales bacterium]HPD24337.1 YraN family protein [Bacteroidales bacterium]HRT00167.1 YraN family protein [Bacteroidales bacterium]